MTDAKSKKIAEIEYSAEFTENTRGGSSADFMTASAQNVITDSRHHAAAWLVS